ncbi:MAG: PrsW family glutamic-type intramembrane protease [Microlunatus sp.]
MVTNPASTPSTRWPSPPSRPGRARPWTGSIIGLSGADSEPVSAPPPAAEQQTWCASRYQRFRQGVARDGSGGGLAHVRRLQAQEASVVRSGRVQLHGVAGSVLYACLAGIGFAYTEDVLYYASALADGGPTELATTVVVRGLFNPFAHPPFTSAIGIGIGVALTARTRQAKRLAPLLGYLVTVAPACHLERQHDGGRRWRLPGRVPAGSKGRLPVGQAPWRRTGLTSEARPLRKKRSHL